MFDATTGAWTQTGQDATALNLAPGDGVLVRLMPNMGDFNLDGAVDVSDLGILATNYGTTNGMTWSDGDANGDGAVDVSDLGILATNYGTSNDPPAPEPVLAVDVWGESNTVQPGFDDTVYCAIDGSTIDPSVTTAAGIAVTLDGPWGGRNRGGAAAPDAPPDFTEHGLLVDMGIPWDVNPATGNERTVTISGLSENMLYDVSVWGYDSTVLGWDLSANGTSVVDDFVTVPVPTTNDDNRMDFQATSDGSGVIVLAYSDATVGGGVGEYPEYRINALQIYTHNSASAVPEPSTICLILAAMGMLLVHRSSAMNV